MTLITEWVPRTFVVLWVVLLAVMLSGCQGSRASDQQDVYSSAQPPVEGKMVWTGSYEQTIQPILDLHCKNCHGAARAENGLRLDSYEGIMKWTSFGQVVVPGFPSSSTLITVLDGTVDPSIRMPHGGTRITDSELRNLILWVEAGAPSNQ